MTPTNALASTARTALIEATPPPPPQNSEVAVSRMADPDPADAENRRILALAHERFRRVDSFESPWRRQASKELDFAAGEHWTPEQKAERMGRPCLVFDRISPAVDQVVNNARQAPPEPRVTPVGNGADKYTAEIIQGLIRNIEIDSCADTAYETAYEHAVLVGRGWWQVLFEFENDIDFTQKIVIKRISNLFSVYPDPSADEFDFRDMRYCFKTEDLDLDFYRELHPNSSVAQLTSFEGIEDKIRNEWFPNGAVRVADYWWVETTVRYICQLPDRSIVDWDQVPEGVTPINTREVRERRVFMAKISGMDILERTEWPGKFIPIIPVLGKEYIHENKRKLRGMVKQAMDANCSYDYMRSKEAEVIGLSSISQWLAAVGAIEGHEKVWAEANRKATAVLLWNTTTDGVTNPAPSRISTGVDVSGITQAIANAENDIKAVLSTYDASLGAPGPESSGRAIIARQREGDNAHFNYQDNLGRSMRHTARVIIDLIPSTYSEERVITIFDPDGKSRQVKINADKIQEGADRIYNLKDQLARYDISIGSGPSYATRMQEAANAWPQLAQSMPIIGQVAADLVAKSTNLPFSDEIAERIRTRLNLPGEGQPNIPPEVQQQLQQMQALIQQLTALLHKATDETERDRLKYASAERIAAMNNEVKTALAEMKIGNERFLRIFEEHLQDRTRLLENNAQTANPGPNDSAAASPDATPGAPPAPQPSATAPASPVPSQAAAGAPA